MQNVERIRDLVALSVLGHLMYETFFQCFEFTGESDGYRSHEKYISAMMLDTLLTVGIWML